MNCLEPVPALHVHGEEGNVSGNVVPQAVSDRHDEDRFRMPCGCPGWRSERPPWALQMIFAAW